MGHKMLSEVLRYWENTQQKPLRDKELVTEDLSRLNSNSNFGVVTAKLHKDPRPSWAQHHEDTLLHGFFRLWKGEWAH